MPLFNPIRFEPDKRDNNRLRAYVPKVGKFFLVFVQLGPNGPVWKLQFQHQDLQILKGDKHIEWTILGFPNSLDGAYQMMLDHCKSYGVFNAKPLNG